MKQSIVEKLLRLVEDNYNLIAQDFSITREKPVWLKAKEIANEIKNKKVLDIGCGNGRLLETLDESVEYLGVDNSEELIKIARTKYSQQFIIDNILDLKKVQNNYYDYVFCLAVLQHIPSKKLRIKALKNIKQKLKPGGILIISNWNLWNTKHKKDIIKSIFKKDLELGDVIFPWKNNKGKEISLRYYHAFTSRKLKKLARDIHLNIIEISKDKYNYWLIAKK